MGIALFGLGVMGLLLFGVFVLRVRANEVANVSAEATGTAAPIPTPIPIVTSTPAAIPVPTRELGATPTVPQPTRPVISTVGPPTVAPTAKPSTIPTSIPPTNTAVPPQPTATPRVVPPTSPPPQPTSPPQPTPIPATATVFVPTQLPVATATPVVVAPTRVATTAAPTIAPSRLPAQPTAVIQTPTQVATSLATAQPAPSATPVTTIEVVVAPTPLAQPTLAYAVYTKAVGDALPDVSFLGVHVFNSAKLNKAPLFGFAPAIDVKIEVRMDTPARIIEAEAAGGEVEMTGQSALLRNPKLAATEDVQFNLGVYAPDMKRLKISVSDSNGAVAIAPAGSTLPPLLRPIEFTSAEQLGRQVAVLQSAPSAIPADPRTPFVIGLFVLSALFAVAGTTVGLNWLRRR